MKLTLAYLIIVIFFSSCVLQSQKAKEDKILESKQSASMQQVEQPVDITSYDLRQQMNAFLIDFAGLIEESADSILQHSEDWTVKDNALRWKMYAIPAAQRAMLVNDPLIGLFDISALCIQMKHFFENGAGNQLFGPYQPLAITTSDSLINRSMQVFSTLSENRDSSKASKTIKKFAQDYPIQSIYFNRMSTTPLLSKYVDKEKMGLKKMASGATETLQQLTERLNLYIDLLPRQARWQAAYLIRQSLEQVASDSITSQVFNRIDHLESYLDRLTMVTERIPSLVDNERRYITADLQQERVLLIEEVRSERVIIFNKITEERKAILSEVDAIANRSITNAFDQLDNLITKVFWMVISAVACGIFLIAILGFLLFQWVKK
ncbi:hypothetical protein V6R21_11225 [Limibacter armeniacum]|uniref:hypothetical protein n=1 Tax=Limibacter armeniacum TaxID=466084 RepID=UPI002FE60B1F